MSEDKKKLNKAQKTAICYGDGPLLIIAGAGTGKTTVITERIKYLISSEKAKTTEILALTFTDKAAREMEERIDIALPYGYSDMWVSTFHSFCDRVLRQEGIHIGINPDYKLMTGAETIQFLIKNIFKFKLKYFRPLGNPTKFISGMLQHFSRLKDEDISCDEYLNWVKKQQKKKGKTKEEEQEIGKFQELALAYKTYEDLKTKEGFFDFADLISKTLELFRKRKNVLHAYQKQFSYILVDEFQDTNHAQNQLAILLAGKKANLTVTGDDDQCLPPDAKISIPNGFKKIKDIKKGNEVITAVGKGHYSFSKVERVFKRKRKVRLLTFEIEDGKKLTVTDNHKMFCFIPAHYESEGWYFVYLMSQQGLGWRIGITNNLPARLRLERHADKILAIGSYRSEREARFYEVFYSVKYGLPTVPFTPRPKQAIEGEWLRKLFSEIDTEKNAQVLAQSLSLELDSPQFILNGVTRGITRRVKVNFQMCYRNYRSKCHEKGFVKNPLISHMISVETSDKKAVKAIRAAGFSLYNTKKGKRLRFQTQDLKEAWAIADKLVKVTGGILDKKFSVGRYNYQHLPARIVPASHILPGMLLPVLGKKGIEYRRVISRKEKEKRLETYDLEVERTHNFVANGVVVHNSVYRFRGAAVSNVIQFRKNYPKAKIVVLKENYRSSQLILDYAYKLIQNNNPDRLEVKEKIDKHLLAVRNVKQSPIDLIYADRVENEADSVALKIKDLSKEYEYSDFAILVRANNHAEPFIRAFARHGIPCQFLGPGQLFRQAEVKDLIAYLKILYNFEDNVALFRVLSMDLFNVFPRDLAALNNFARRQNFSLFESCEEVDKLFVGQKTKEQINSFVKMVHRHLGLLNKETAGQILYYFLQDTGLLKKLAEYKSVREEKMAQNIAKFFDRLRSYEVDHEDATVLAVVDWINLSMNLGESPSANNFDWTEENKVNILTVHSSKGLEFPVVFLINLVQARFPTQERREQIPIPDQLIKEILPSGNYHEQEERRLFYVGMTRARDKLIFSLANYYGEGKREKKISPFVIETLDEKIIKKEILEDTDQLSIFDYKKEEEQEEVLERQVIQVGYLSYSQLETFNNCPLQYRYRYLQRIPVPASAAQSLGNSVHLTLKDFLQGIKDKKKLKEKDLLSLLDKNWASLGYSDKAHEKTSKKSAQRMMINFYKDFDKKTNIQFLEQPFVIKVSPSLRVGGKIDRVDKVGKDKIEIIDYKTGRMQDQKEINKSLQMTVYALAAQDKGIYDKNPKDVILTFYFLDLGKKMSTSRTSEQLKEVREEIIKKSKEISKSDFEAKPSRLCDFCDYKLICEAWN